LIGIDKMPIQIAFRVVEAAGDVRLQRSDVLSLATIARYTSPDGTVGADETGKPMSDPSAVAKKIGAAGSTIRKSFGSLERAGYIQWRRAWSPELGGFGGVAASVRIILPDHTPQS
jgi:hypothetical protein